MNLHVGQNRGNSGRARWRTNLSRRTASPLAWKSRQWTQLLSDALCEISISAFLFKRSASSKGSIALRRMRQVFSILRSDPNESSAGSTLWSTERDHGR
jgi:hypothetical protein